MLEFHICHYPMITTENKYCLFKCTPSIGRKVGIPIGILPHVQTGLTIGIQISLPLPGLTIGIQICLGKGWILRPIHPKTT